MIAAEPYELHAHNNISAEHIFDRIYFFSSVKDK